MFHPIWSDTGTGCSIGSHMSAVAQGGMTRVSRVPHRWWVSEGRVCARVEIPEDLGSTWYRTVVKVGKRWNQAMVLAHSKCRWGTPREI